MNKPATDISDKLRLRSSRKAEKREARKNEIAASTLDALKQLGYANTTLRDIASQSGLSLGSLSYYFTGKEELIVHCVRLYKEEFVGRMETAVSELQGREAVVEGFAVELVRAIVEDRSTHRLWYDIRTQAMFDAGFEPVVQEIEEKLQEIVANAMRAVGHRDVSAAPAGYAMIDGLFLHLMQSHDAGRVNGEQIKTVFRSALERLF